VEDFVGFLVNVFITVAEYLNNGLCNNLDKCNMFWVDILYKSIWKSCIYP